MQASWAYGSAGGWGWFRVVRAAVRIPAHLAAFPHFSHSCLNTHTPLTPCLVQLRTVSKMTVYGELGDDAMGKQGRRAGLAGVLAGGVALSPTSPSKAGSRNPPHHSLPFWSNFVLSLK